MSTSRNYSKTVVLLLLMAFFGAVSGWTASGVMAQQDIRQQIGSVSERLEQIRPLVEDSGSRLAEQRLEEAGRLLEDAGRVLERDGNEIQARNFVRRALELINAAVQVASQNRGLAREEVERELVRLRDHLRQTEEILDSFNANRPTGDDLLERARREAEQARSLFENNLYQRALERIHRSTELSSNARRRVDQADSSLPDGLEILEQLDQLIANVEDRLSSISSAANPVQALQNARLHRDKAVEFSNRGQNHAAMQHARRSRDILLWLLQQSDQPGSNFNEQRRAQRELERNRALLQEARQSLGNNSGQVDSELQSLLSRAENLYQQAQQASLVENYSLALSLTNQSINLAAQIILRAENEDSPGTLGPGPGPVPEAVEVSFEEYQTLVSELLPEALEQVRKNPGADAVRYLEQAQAAAVRAESYMNREEHEAALREIARARTLARQAVQILRK
jgi:hypothetical protein